MSRASDAPDSSRKLPSTCPMREASFSWMARSRSIALDLLFLSELAEEHHAGHRVEGVEHAHAATGDALARRHPARAPVFLADRAGEHHAGPRVGGGPHAHAATGDALERRHPPRAPVQHVLE